MNNNQLFTSAHKIQLLNTEDAVTAASYPASGAFIDVSQFERFVFLVAAGALNSATSCQVQQATAVNGALKDITGAVVAIAATGDDKWYAVEVQTDRLDGNNDYRYVTLTLTGPAGGDDYAAILFIGVNPGEQPVTQGSDKGEIVVVAG